MGDIRTKIGERCASHVGDVGVASSGGVKIPSRDNQRGRLTAPSRRGARHELFKANTLSAAVGISVLVHTAALAAFLMQEVAPYSPPRLEVVEVTLVPAQVLDDARANSVSEAIPGDSSVEALTQSFLSLTHPDMAAKAPSRASPGWRRQSPRITDMEASGVPSSCAAPEASRPMRTI